MSCYTTKERIVIDNVDISNLKVGDTVLVLYPSWHDHCQFYRKHTCSGVFDTYITISDPYPQDLQIEFRRLYKYTSDEDIFYANNRLIEILPRFQTIARLKNNDHGIENKCNHDVFKKVVRDIYMCESCGLRKTIDDLLHL